MAYNFDVGLSVVAIVVSVAAIVVSLVLFRIGQTSTKKTEQVRICREIWEGIETQNHNLRDWVALEVTTRQSRESRMKLKKALDKLRNELSYLVKLVEIGEMKELFILDYYQDKLLGIHSYVKGTGKLYPDVGAYPETQEILNLIKKYHELTGKINEYEAQDTLT
jgi:hypothetical protein